MTNSPKLDGSLEDWLQQQLISCASQFKNRTLMLDVGAYHGDFTRTVLDLKEGPLREAILFEPNPQNRDWIKQHHGDDKRLRVEPVAVGNQAGEAKLFCQGELYTGSILPYQTEVSSKQTEIAVPVITLDEFLTRNKLQERVGFIKVDTQGNDLRVLQGAVNTLRVARPWLVVEMIRVPLYVKQANPAEVILWLEQQGYFLAAQFNEIYTQTGWLGWYDACFVPQEFFSMDVHANAVRPTATSVRESIPKGFRKKLKWALKNK